MDKAQQLDQLLPGLPDDLVLQSVLPRLPYYVRARAQRLSRSWHNMLLHQEGHLEEQQRWRLALLRHRGLLLRHAPSCTLTFLDFADMRTYPLPPLPFPRHGIGASFTFVFCANRRIFAAQRSASSSIKRLFMLDVAAGLFRWQQRFGPPSPLHRRHIGDGRGCIQVSSPYMCIIVGFKVYVVAESLPASLWSMDRFRAVHYLTEPNDVAAAAMYDAWEDTWEEIPSPLGSSSTARLVGLCSSQAGVVAKVYDNQFHFYTGAAMTLIFLDAQKQWYDTSKVNDEMRPNLSFSTHSYLQFSIVSKDDEAVCTCCGAPTIGRSLEYVDPTSCLYKLCRCYSQLQPDVANAVMAHLSKLGWRFLNDTSDKPDDDEEDSDESE